MDVLISASEIKNFSPPWNQLWHSTQCSQGKREKICDTLKWVGVKGGVMWWLHDHDKISLVNLCNEPCIVEHLKK